MYRFSHQLCFLTPLCSFKLDYIPKWLAPHSCKELLIENTVTDMGKQKETNLLSLNTQDMQGI